MVQGQDGTPQLLSIATKRDPELVTWPADAEHAMSWLYLVVTRTLKLLQAFKQQACPLKFLMLPAILLVVSFFLDSPKL